MNQDVKKLARKGPREKEDSFRQLTMNNQP